MIDVQALMDDKKFVKFVINKIISCQKMLELLDVRGGYDHNIYCPFHPNHDTPSARMYKADDGSDSIFCYSEHKVYRSSDFITKGLINYRLDSIFYKTWIQLPPEIQSQLIDSYNGDISYIPEKFKENIELMSKFRVGEITVSQLNQIILDSLK